MARAATSVDRQTLIVTDDGPAARVTLNRPDRRNALSLELMEELTRVLRTLGARSDPRAIVLEATGVAFSSGHDLSARR